MPKLPSHPPSPPRRALLRWSALGGLAGLSALARAQAAANHASVDLAQPGLGGGPDAHKTLAWSDLLPARWDPVQVLRSLGIQNLEALNDADPKCMATLQRQRLAWDQAPLQASLEGQRIKLPGFLLPLTQDQVGLRDCLLVPRFGGCLHAPPPPANQVVRMVLTQPLSGLRAMDTVWALGVLRMRRTSTTLGVAGYRLEDARLVRYLVTPR